MANQQITTIRTRHGKENPYFLMARATAQDDSLSWEARGVLSYLLSKPDDWQIRVSDLQQKCGRDKVYTILSELEAARYLTREQQQIEGGKFGAIEYRVYETPQPLTEKPYTDLPYTENPPLHNTDKKQKKEKDISPSGDSGAAQPEKKQATKTSTPASDMNPMKDAIFAAFGYTSWQTLTLTEKGLIQVTAKELLGAGAKPEDIPGLYRYCKNKFTSFKPRALAGNWSDYAMTRKPATSAAKPNVIDPDMAMFAPPNPFDVVTPLKKVSNG